MIGKIARHRSISIIFLLSFLLVVGGFFWAYGKLSGEAMVWNEGAGPFILHFNLFDGITATGDFSGIVSMGVLGAVIVILNFFIGMALEERDRTLSLAFAGATLAMAILLFLSFVAILNVN